MSKHLKCPLKNRWTLNPPLIHAVYQDGLEMTLTEHMRSVQKILHQSFGTSVPIFTFPRGTDRGLKLPLGVRG
jgi:hypothetical protein